MKIESLQSRPVPSATPTLAAVLAMALSAALLAIMLSVALDLPKRFADDTAVTVPAMKGVPIKAPPLARASMSKYKIGTPECRDGSVGGGMDRLICL